MERKFSRIRDTLSRGDVEITHVFLCNLLEIGLFLWSIMYVSIN